MQTAHEMERALQRRLGLVALSAGILAQLAPKAEPVPAHGLAFFASLAVLICCLRGTGARWGFRLGLLWGAITYGSILFWLWEIFRWPAIGLWLLLAMFVGVFGAWFGAATKEDVLSEPFGPPPAGERKLTVYFGLVAAVMWTGIEYYRCEWFWLRFPWITPGTAMEPTLLAPVVGAYGMTFLVALACTWLALGRWKVAFAGGGVFAVIAWLAVVPPDPVTIPEGEGIRVALVQSEAGYFGAYRELTDSIDAPVDAIVWPEYALSYDVRKDAPEMARIEHILAETGARFLTLGSRTDRPDGKWHNTAVTIGVDGVLGTHDKNRPVHFFEDGEPGEELKAFETPLGKAATPVCFDCDYTAVARRLVSDGAEFILAPSMDAEHWTARQHEQHAVLFRHRAAETGRWIAVAATSGVTQIIDPGGNVIDRLPTMTEEVLVGRIGRNNHRTFYARIGWVFGPACTILAGIILLATGVRDLIPRRSESGG